MENAPAATMQGSEESLIAGITANNIDNNNNNNDNKTPNDNHTYDGHDDHDGHDATIRPIHHRPKQVP